jgi:hypothetical protein
MAALNSINHLINFKNTLYRKLNTQVDSYLHRTTGIVTGAAVSRSIAKSITSPIKVEVAQSLDERYNKATKEMKTFETREGSIDAIQKSIEPMSDLAETHEQLGMHYQKMIDFLKAKMPKSSVSNMLDIESGRVTDVEKRTFLKYYDFCTNPNKIIEQFPDIEPAAMEVLKAHYPLIYDRMRQSVINAVAKLDNKHLPYQKQAVLSKFLGQPTNIINSQKFIQSTQARWGKIDRQNAKDQAQQQANISQIADNYKTDSQRRVGDK